MSTSSPRGCNETNVSTEQSTQKAHTRVPGAHGNRGRTQGSEASSRQGAQAADGQHPTQAAALGPERRDERFPKANRIRWRGEFVYLQRIGRRRSGNLFVVILAPAKHKVSRLGITASRKVGGAVVRNRIKRWVREFFRRSKDRIRPARDMVVIVRPNLTTATYADVAQELTRILQLPADDR